MPEQVRTLELWGARTFTGRDKINLEPFTFAGVPMRLLIDEDGKVKLTVEVWEEVPDFLYGKPTGSKFNRTFVLPLESAKTEYPQFFDPILETCFSWLGVSENDYNIKTLDINLTTLKISVVVNHKEKVQKVSRETADVDEFNEVKADYPELVEGYFGFAWGYAEEHDPKLALFE